METQQSVIAALTLLAIAAVLGDYLTTEKLRKISGSLWATPISKWLINRCGKWWALPKLGTVAGAVVVGLYVSWPINLGILLALVGLLGYAIVHNMRALRT